MKRIHFFAAIAAAFVALTIAPPVSAATGRLIVHNQTSAPITYTVYYSSGYVAAPRTVKPDDLMSSDPGRGTYRIHVVVNAPTPVVLNATEHLQGDFLIVRIIETAGRYTIRP